MTDPAFTPTTAEQAAITRRFNTWVMDREAARELRRHPGYAGSVIALIEALDTPARSHLAFSTLERCALKAAAAAGRLDGDNITRSADADADSLARWF